MAKKEAENLRSENRELQRQIQELRDTVQKLLQSPAGGGRAGSGASKSKSN
jgi:hypothetical protein